MLDQLRKWSDGDDRPIVIAPTSPEPETTISGETSDQIDRIVTFDGCSVHLLSLPEATAASTAGLGVLRKRLRTIKREVLPIVLSNASIAPQVQAPDSTTPGLAEIESLRRGLMMANRPLLCLSSGHVTDCIEIVSSPEWGISEAQLLLIGAPPLQEGYNVIEIGFGAGSQPLRCTVMKWRYRAVDGDVAPVEVRIPLGTGSSHPGKLLNPEAWQLYHRLPDAIRGDDLLDQERRNGWGDDAMEQRLLSLLVELEERGMVLLENRKHRIQEWVIRRMFR